MDSSDDEAVIIPQSVSGYHFENGHKEFLSFAELPVQWSEKSSPECVDEEIYVRGTAENGLQHVHRQVIAWKFDISRGKPEISVLSKDNNWIKLDKPRKAFEVIIRSILITVQCLHLVKRNPEVTGKALWDRLSRVFSLYDPRPSENDLIDHVDFIGEAVKRDKALVKSKFLAAFLEEKPRKRKAVPEDAGALTRPGFIVDDTTEEPEEDDLPNEDEDEESDEESDSFDSVCAICDNGGDLLCCEGKCLRSFHATDEAGSESMCQSLGLSAEEVEATPTFFCKNCQYDMHQCYVCGKLGSSKKSMDAEVFQCSSATCGHFYHPQCVAKLLHRESEAEAKDLQEKIAAGNPFTCPAHKCSICKQAENEDVSDLQFATCRRCPKSYHRKCMPRKIVLCDPDDDDDEILARAWPNLLPKNRLLIYCLKHEIDDELKTPSRDHIRFPHCERFPDSEPKIKKKRASELQSSSREVAVKAIKTPGSVPEKISAVKSSKGVQKLSSIEKQNDSSKKRLGNMSVSEPSKKQKVVHNSQKVLNKSSSIKAKKSVMDVNQKSLGDKLYDLMVKGSESGKSKEAILAVGEQQHTQTSKNLSKEAYRSPSLDNDSKNRILAMMRDATSSVTLEEVIQKHKVPTTHSSRNLVDRNITLGKVERSVEALRLAVKKLEEGCSIEDAKAVCDPGVLQQIMRWKNKLRVYLAPFLHGMRYTSFGRHFTKVPKLKEIVDILHWYVQEGDTIVDFCCGSNDFSCIMKEKLDEMKKQCSYKNYDIIQPQIDFNFEKRDWMTVRPKELPPGSQLIMGLNPPFGVNGALANKFIDKALQFKPKLVILIVPPETERLDRKKSPYDLVWEDNVLLAGKSFYLPGSVDVNDKQIDQWNLVAPPLYLWSRQDWTGKHKEIAKQHGHYTRLEDNPDTVLVDAPLKHEGKAEVPAPLYNQPVTTEEPKVIPEKATIGVTGDHKNHAHDQGGVEVKKENRGAEVKKENGGVEVKKENQGAMRNLSVEKSKKNKKNGEGKRGGARDSDSIVLVDKGKERYTRPRLSDNISPEYKEKERKSLPPLHSPLHTDTRFEEHEKFDQSLTSPHMRYERSYNRTREDDLARGRSPNINETYGGSTYGRLDGASSLAHDYVTRPPETNFPGYQRESIDRGYSSRSYADDTRSSLGQRSSYLAGHEPGGSYVQPAAVTQPSYGMSSSTMQRYAPRLDELNHTRVSNSFAPEPLVNRSGGYGHQIHGHGPYDPSPPPLARPGSRVDTLGFAPGPYRTFSQNNSSGWLNE